MNKKYEDACRNSGLSKDEIAKIRNAIDNEKKKLKREKIYRKERGIIFVNVDDITDFSDDLDIEELAINKVMLKKLDDILNDFPVADREFILSSFSGDRGFLSRYAKEHGINRSTALRKRDRLFEKIKNKFFES